MLLQDGPGKSCCETASVCGGCSSCGAWLWLTCAARSRMALSVATADSKAVCAAAVACSSCTTSSTGTIGAGLLGALGGDGVVCVPAATATALAMLGGATWGRRAASRGARAAWRWAALVRMGVGQGSGNGGMLLLGRGGLALWWLWGWGWLPPLPAGAVLGSREFVFQMLMLFTGAADGGACACAVSLCGRGCCCP